MPYHDYSMSIEDQEIKKFNREYESAMVTIANLMARATDQWAPQEKKLFYLFVSQMDTRDSDNWIRLNRADAMALLGFEPSEGQKFNRCVRRVQDKSMVEFRKKDIEAFNNRSGGEPLGFNRGLLLDEVEVTRNTVAVHFKEKYIHLLHYVKDQLFTRFELTNLLGLSNSNSISLYLYLASWHHKGQEANIRQLSKEEVCHAFGLKEGQYWRERKRGGRQLDTYLLQKRIIEPALKDIKRANEQEHTCDLNVLYCTGVANPGSNLIRYYEISWNYSNIDNGLKLAEDVNRKKAILISDREKMLAYRFMRKFKELEPLKLISLSRSLGTYYHPMTGEELSNWPVESLEYEQKQNLISSKLCKNLMSRAGSDVLIPMIFESSDLVDFLDTLECVNLAIDAQ